MPGGGTYTMIDVGRRKPAGGMMTAQPPGLARRGWQAYVGVEDVAASTRNARGAGRQGDDGQDGDRRRPANMSVIIDPTGAAHRASWQPQAGGEAEEEVRPRRVGSSASTTSSSTAPDLAAGAELVRRAPRSHAPDGRRACADGDAQPGPEARRVALSRGHRPEPEGAENPAPPRGWFELDELTAGEATPAGHLVGANQRRALDRRGVLGSRSARSNR